MSITKTPTPISKLKSWIVKVVVMELFLTIFFVVLTYPCPSTICLTNFSVGPSSYLQS